MKKTLTLVAVLALAACSTGSKEPTYEHPASMNRGAQAPVQSGVGAPVVSAGTPSTQARVTPYRAGYGTVEAAMAGAAAAGATVPPAYELHIRMDDGTMQWLAQSSPEFRVGDRVEVTTDGRVIRR